MLAKKQAIYRLSKGIISPFSLNQSKQNLDLIQQMIELMEESIGEKQQNIDQSSIFSRTVMATKNYSKLLALLLDRF